MTRPTAPQCASSSGPHLLALTPKLTSIVERAVCPAVSTDRYNRIVVWNTRFTDLTGHGITAGTNLQDLLHCRHPNGNLLSHSHAAIHEMVLAGEGPAAFEIDLEAENRPPVRAEVSIVVVIGTDPEDHWLIYLLRPRLHRRRIDDALERLLMADAPPLRRNSRNASPTLLTRRQLQVLQVMATGASATEIASELEISINTVRSHIRAIFRAFEVTRQTEAVARAVREHLI